MTAGLPSGPPPPELAAKAIPYLAARVAAASVDGPNALIPVLKLTMATLATARLAGTPVAPPLSPLHAFASLAAEDPEAISLPLLCDALLAYPAETALLSVPVARTVDMLPELIGALVDRLGKDATPRTLLSTSRLLHALMRAHDEAAALLLTSAETLVPALSACYAAVGKGKDATRAKAEALTFVRALAHLAGPGSAALRRLFGPPTGGTPLVDGGLADDYELFHQARPNENAAAALRDLHDDERGDDPRLAPLLHLFPNLPTHLLIEALSHPRFAAASSRASVEEQASPLIDAILAGTLPPELSELRAAAAAISASGAPDHVEDDVQPSPAAAPAKIERRNVFNDQPLDLSRIRVKGHNDPVVGTEIPEHLRESIKRLVVAQEEEAEAAARAVAEAHGTTYRPGRTFMAAEDEDDMDDDLPAARVKLADGEESGASDDDDDDDIDSDSDASASGGPSQARTPRNNESNQAQALLEIAYLRNPGVFARDATTRRSAARKDLRAATGWDDGQLEGWKIMLERNPHKEAILERHQWAAAPPAASGGGGGAGGKKKEGGGGGGGSGGKGGNNGGGGGSGSGSGGGRGGNNNSGGGRGRGGASKGSRGHSNAARTRGNDRKMARMGAGL